MSFQRNSALVLVLVASGIAISGCNSGDSTSSSPDADTVSASEVQEDAGGAGGSTSAPISTETEADSTPGNTAGTDGNPGDVDDQSVEANPSEVVVVDPPETPPATPETPPTSSETPPTTPETPPTTSETPPATTPEGVVDLSGGDDDSPTLTESLSLTGPSIKDPSRGAGPPSAPTGLTRLIAATNWLEFSWTPSTDDQAVSAYEIYRDGQLINTLISTDYTPHVRTSWLSTTHIDCNFTRDKSCDDENLQPAPGASYAYSVVAVDNEGMRSPPSEEVVMRMATPRQTTMDLSGYTKVFEDDFDDTFLDPARWRTSLPWGENEIVNQEKQYYVNIYGSTVPVNYDPFKFTGDTLKITGINTPADQVAAANGQPYLSGVLTTLDRFKMTYGYVEMRAKLPAGKGIIPTFYLFNADYERNKPEIDIVEYLGGIPDKLYQTYHYYDSNRAQSSIGEKHSSPTMEYDAGQNLSADFHTYGVLWESELIIWYIDGVEMRRLEGPRVSDEPMNIVAQLVMGSVWRGDPDPAAIPAEFEIDYIYAWQK